MSGFDWVWVFGSILIAGAVLALTLWFVVPAVLDLCADAWWWLRNRRRGGDEWGDRPGDYDIDEDDDGVPYCPVHDVWHVGTCDEWEGPVVGALPPVPVPLELAPGGDWREQTALELAPEHLAAEAERIELPLRGDAQGWESSTDPDDPATVAAISNGRQSVLAGDRSLESGSLSPRLTGKTLEGATALQAQDEWPTDMRLPAVLNLGRPGDGTDKTFARWQIAQWDHMTRIHADEERVERELAWGRAA